MKYIYIRAIWAYTIEYYLAHLSITVHMTTLHVMRCHADALNLAEAVRQMKASLSSNIFTKEEEANF